MSTNYATILTEEADSLRIRYIANKHIFQNFKNPVPDPNDLSSIVALENNTSVLTVFNNWVGVGVTTPSNPNDTIFQVNNDSVDSMFIVGKESIGINTSISPNNGNVLSVYGNTYFQNNVGIGTTIANERLRVNGNIQAYTFKARGSDYAEWEELADSVEEIPIEGTVVGFNEEGKIVTNYKDSVHFGVVSHKPSLIGNEKLLSDTRRCIPIVYMGKIDMKIEQPIRIGDFIVPVCTVDNKISFKVVSRSDITLQEHINAVGYIHKPLLENVYEVIVRI